MNLEDLAKKTIDEVSKQVSKEPVNEPLKEQKKLDDEVSFEIARSKLADTERIDEKISDAQASKALEEASKEQVIDLNAYEKNIENNLKSSESSQISVEESSSNKALNFNEELFLKNLRERILVLFEGLKSTKDEDLKARLELCINFLEFLLASIEDKLKK